MIQALIFDFDGVLADSEPLHLAAYQEVFAALGVTLTRDDYYANLLGYDDEGVFHVMSSRHGWRLDRERIAALVAEKSRVFKDIIPAHDVLYPGAASAIERLGSTYPLGIASGAVAVGAGISIAGIIGAVAGRPTTVVRENVDYNQSLRTAWEDRNRAIARANDRIRRFAPLRLRVP